MKYISISIIILSLGLFLLLPSKYIKPWEKKSNVLFLGRNGEIRKRRKNLRQELKEDKKNNEKKICKYRVAKGT